jgi:hypothetical protein
VAYQAIPELAPSSVQNCDEFVQTLEMWSSLFLFWRPDACLVGTRLVQSVVSLPLEQTGLSSASFLLWKTKTLDTINSFVCDQSDKIIVLARCCFLLFVFSLFFISLEKIRVQVIKILTFLGSDGFLIIKDIEIT